jgi:flagellar biosynthesis/type III secretory pathway protein FliH
MTRSRILRGQTSQLSIVDPEALLVLEEDLSSERDRTLNAAWDAGYADGLERARATAECEAEQARTTFGRARLALSDAATQAASAFELERRRLECGAVELAFALTKAILARELELSRSPGEEAITRAVSESPAGCELIVRLNPADVETIGDETRLDAATRIVADPSIGPGSCVLEIGTTVVDARIDTALERVRQVFDEATGHE